MKNFFKKSKWMVLALLIAALAGRALLTNKHFHAHDDIQIFRVGEYIKCFQDGQFPCRWSKNLGKGFGYPLFVFYPPVIYAVPALFSSFGLSINASLNLFAFLTFPLAAFSMFKLVKKLTAKSHLAFLASASYTLYPYHAVSVFVRGVYAETFAWSLFPLVLESFYTLIKEKKPSLRPAFLLVLIFLSHNISAMLMLPLTILWIGVLIAPALFTPARTQLKALAFPIALNLIAPVAVAFFFLFPALSEKSLVQTDSMIYGYYSFVNHFVSIRQLLFSTYWGYGGSNFGTEYDEMSFMIGGVYWVSFVLILLVRILMSWRARRFTLDLLSTYLITLGPVFFFLTHARSTPIWLLFPALSYIQFPWRLVGIGGFFLISGTIYILHRTASRWNSRLSILVTAILLFLYLPYFRPVSYDDYQDSDYLTGELTRNQQQEHLYDYLPKTVKSVPDEFAVVPIFKSDSDVEVSDVIWRSNLLQFDYSSSLDQKILLSIFGYPGWSMRIDGQLIPYKLDPNYGMLLAEIPAGRHSLSAVFTDTKPRRVANYISLAAIALCLWYQISLRYGQGKRTWFKEHSKVE